MQELMHRISSIGEKALASEKMVKVRSLLRSWGQDSSQWCVRIGDYPRHQVP
jgi:hypothetical protein